MKKLIIFSIIISTIFFSCATDSTVSKKENAVQSSEISQDTMEINYEELTVSPSIPHFDDWKYKGFGSEIPDWVEPALDRDIEKLLTMMSTSQENVIEVDTVLTYGVNLDHAEKRSEETGVEPDWELRESFWVRINKDFEELEEPYVLVQLLVKK